MGATQAASIASAGEEDEDDLAAASGDIAWTLVASRVLAAVVGGYLLCYTFVAAAARLLPLSKPDKVLASTMLGLFLYIGVVVWVFGAKSTARVWGALLVLSAIFYVISIR